MIHKNIDLLYIGIGINTKLKIIIGLCYVHIMYSYCVYRTETIGDGSWNPNNCSLRDALHADSRTDFVTHFSLVFCKFLGYYHYFLFLICTPIGCWSTMIMFSSVMLVCRFQNWTWFQSDLITVSRSDVPHLHYILTLWWWDFLALCTYFKTKR